MQPEGDPSLQSRGCEPIVSTSEEASASTSMARHAKARSTNHPRTRAFSYRFVFSLITCDSAVPNGSWYRGSLDGLSGTVRDDRYISASDRFDRLANTYITDVTKGGSSCRYVDTVFPHPYLGFVHHGNPPCGLPNINNVGLFNDDFPAEPLRDQYVILLTGGSVAAQLGQNLQPPAPRFLELALNERFVAPKGTSFKVLNGGDGAWKQPQQAILMLLHAHAIDAVVTLRDGFNEHQMLRNGTALEHPGSNFMSINPLVTESFGTVVSKWVVSRAIGKLDSHPYLKHSQTAYLASEALAAWFRKEAGEVTDRKTTVQSLFALPRVWDATRRIDFGVDQYEKYMIAMNGIAKAFDIRIVHFIQPAPATGKSLSVG